MLAPVGYRVPMRALVSSAALAVVGKNAEADLMRALERYFGASRAFGVSSGKAALTLVLLALHHMTGRRKVIIPAYTCYSVPSAIVKAGLDVVPCDIGEEGFDYDYEQLRVMLGPDVLCVLSVHLFGIPSDTPRLKAACRDTGIFVVEDAAQAMGGSLDGRLLGTIGDAGFFSLGRGKNVTCGTGGIVLARDPEIATAIDAVVVDVPGATRADDAFAFLTLLALSALLSPPLYWLPSGLPFLRLGETIFHEDFPVRRLSSFQALLLRDWLGHLSTLDAIRRENARYYRANIVGVSRGFDLAYLRFPVVLPDPGRRRRLMDERDGAVLGIRPMYPASVGAIPQLRGRLSECDFPRSERVARSLVTLPTHPFVTAGDRARICEAVNSVLDQAPGIHEATGHPVAHMSGGL